MSQIIRSEGWEYVEKTITELKTEAAQPQRFDMTLSPTIPLHADVPVGEDDALMDAADGEISFIGYGGEDHTIITCGWDRTIKVHMDEQVHQRGQGSPNSE